MIPKLDEYKKQFEIESEDVVKPGLETIQEALTYVLNPEKDLRIIHVAGTNGKGSTIAVMEAVLQAHGYSTGVFSSPAMIDLHDQIRINGKPITSVELEFVFEEINAVGLSGMLTDFELLTVAAFIAFRNASPDYVLLETGMGGRFDSTNVVTPLVSVITSIALDHTGFLGDTERKIARHKAGIIKPGVPVVVGELSGEVQEVIEDEAELNRSSLYVYGKDFRMNGNIFEGMQTFDLPERRMKGPHQAINYAVALEALLAAGIPLKQKAIAEAIRTAQLPFRFQEIGEGVFIDGAHNPAAANMLVKTIEEQLPGEKVDWVIGMLNTKDYGEVLKSFAPLANSFTFVDFPHPQAASAEDLLAVSPINENKIVSISEIDLKPDPKYKKVIAGSLYLLSSLMRQ